MLLLFRAPSPIHLAARLSTTASPALGFDPSSRLHSRAATFLHRPPTAHFDPRSGFRSLFTVSSALELAGLFHPAATSRVLCRSGASLPAQPPFLFGRSLPPCRCCIAARRARSDFRRLALTATNDASRLRGFDPRRAAFLGFGYSPHPRPLPSSDSFSSRLTHSTWCRLSPPPPALVVRKLGLSIARASLRSTGRSLTSQLSDRARCGHPRSSSFTRCRACGSPLGGRARAHRPVLPSCAPFGHHGRGPLWRAPRGAGGEACVVAAPPDAFASSEAVRATATRSSCDDRGRSLPRSEPPCSWIAPQGTSCSTRGCAGARGCFAASAFSGVARFAARAPLSTLAVASSCDARGRASRSVASGVALRGRGSLASFDAGSHDRLRAHRSRIRACGARGYLSVIALRCSRAHLSVIACAACASALSSHDRSLSADALRHRSIARDVLTRRAAPTFSCAFGRGHLAVLAIDCGRRRFDLSFCFRGGRDPDVFGCGHPLAKTSPAVPGAIDCLHLAMLAVGRSRGRGSACSGSRSGACTLRCSRSSAC